MLAVFPILAISLLAGGVGVGQFWRVVLVAVNNLFLSLSLGMFCSAVSRDERKAVGLAVGLMVFVAAILPLIGVTIKETYNQPANLLFFVGSPGYAAFMSFEEMQKNIPTFNYFYVSVATIHLTAWTLLWLSCRIVPRTWQDKVETRGAPGRRAFWRDIEYGTALTRA